MEAYRNKPSSSYIGNYNRSQTVNRSAAPSNNYNEHVANLQLQNELQKQNHQALPNDDPLPVFDYETRTEGRTKPELPDVTSMVPFDIERPLPPRFRAGIGQYLPKEQHILYRTANGNYGNRGSNEQEMLTKYYARSNIFSKSFNGFAGSARDCGLNTSMRQPTNLDLVAKKKEIYERYSENSQTNKAKRAARS